MKTRKTARRHIVILHLQTSQIPTTMIVLGRRKGAGAIAFDDTIVPSNFRCISKIVLVLAQLSYYQSTKGTREPLNMTPTVSYTNLGGIMTSSHPKFIKSRKKVTVHVKDQAFYGKEAI